ncbi:Integrase zinc binding domain [Popillia japonica]|uniref:Integrase zinc binding domain n=1 Tax=Popillia japonica TaxID=7064 RepID=A0AAW1KPM9_POPJA
MNKTIDKVKQPYWFPGIRRYVRGYISACIECLYYKCPGGNRPGKLNSIAKCPGGNRPGKLNSIAKVGIPYHTIHVDHLGPFVRSKGRYSYVTVAVDGFTKHTHLKAAKNTTAREVVKFMDEICDIFGPPQRRITDRHSVHVDDISKIIHVLNASAAPRANGQVERLNCFVTSALATLTKEPEGRDWDRQIGRLQYGINNTYHKAIKTTPFRLLMNYEPRNYEGNPLEDETREQKDAIIMNHCSRSKKKRWGSWKETKVRVHKKEAAQMIKRILSIDREEKEEETYQVH